MSTKRDKTFTSALEQFWLDALPVVINDSYGYQSMLNPGSLGTSRELITGSRNPGQFANPEIPGAPILRFSGLKFAIILTQFDTAIGVTV